MILSIEEFSQLWNDDQFTFLNNLFERIKDKNENCSYIYKFLVTKPDFVSREVMKVIYDNIMSIYNRIVNEENESFNLKMQKSRSTLWHIQRQEMNEKSHVNDLLILLD